MKHPGDLLSAAALALACLALFLTAPLHGEFLWSESPRNALNGAFILDLLRERPLSDPVGWATAYYLQYPALTILFYPPLLHAALAVVYALLGVSHMSAMACMAAFAFLLALGTYTWARQVADWPAALAVALLLLAAPGVVLWGQQVMLEVPMMAFAVWGAVLVARYGEQAAPGRWPTLALAALCLLSAIHVKQQAAFIALGLAAGLLAWRGPSLLARRHLIVTAALAALALVPLMLVQWRFARFNIESATNRPGMDVASFSLEGLAWYAARLPENAGWPLLAVTVAAATSMIVRRDRRPPRGKALLLGGWFVATYAALTVIHLKEARFGLPLLVPIAVLAAGPLDHLLRARPLRLAAPAAAAVLLALTLWRNPTLGATGYAEAAALVAEQAPPRGRIVFSGNRDGAFIFNVRSHPTRRDLAVVRSDKLFLDIRIQPEFGLNARQKTRDEISALLNRIGISHVVAVPGQWTEASVKAEFEAVLASEQFEMVRRIPVTGPVGERELVVYRNRGPLADPPEPYGANLAAAGIRIAPGPARAQQP